MMTDRIAALPMYDWPEVRPAIDQLWSAVADELAAAGLDAPTTLTRATDDTALWLDPHLIIGQTCGLPLVRELDPHVHVLGALTPAVPHLGPGEYNSLVVCRSDSDLTDLGDARDGVVVFNGPDSQSGYAALQVVVAPLARAGRFFRSGIESGSHRASIRAVADGRADVAAIDVVSWALAQDHEPLARRLRILTTTPPTPGLPFITAKENLAHRVVLDSALRTAIDGLDESKKRILHIAGYESRTAEHYHVLRKRVESAEAFGYHRLD